MIAQALVRLFARGTRMAGNPGVVGALRISPRQVWAVARMTLLEASRRKVFAILGLFSIALVASAGFFPSVEPAARLRLMEVWALRAASLFTAIIALFITGSSFPSDFEQKRIYLLVTKPVAKATIYLGKWIGLSLLLAIFVATMGGVTVLFIRCVKVLSGPSFPPMIARERVSGGTFEVLRPASLAEEGTEKRSFITAEKVGALVWRFAGLGRRDFEERISLESHFAVGSPTDQWRASGTILLEARGAGGTQRVEQFLNTNEEKDWSVPASILGEDGALELAFRCADSDGYLGGSRQDLSLYRKPGNFELAFGRGLVLLFLQTMTVLSLTLMASSILSAPLSILLGILLYIVGSSYAYVKDGTRDIDRSLQERQAGTASPPLQDDIPPWFLVFSSKVSKWVLAVVPDFDHFDFSRWLLKDRAVSNADLGVALGHAAPPVLVLGLLGMLVLAYKDFG